MADSSSKAERQLRVIRSLMERATIYRSLSAPTALVGGLLSLGGLGVEYGSNYIRGGSLSSGEFFAVWLSILAMTLATNGYFLWREAQQRGTALFSAGMKCALQSVGPPFLLAGVLTFVAPRDPLLCVFGWIICYGLGLLSMQHFTPRSLVVLGWTFLAAGILAVPAGMFVIGDLGVTIDPNMAASLLMAITFGGFHIIYAIAVWVSGEERSAAAEPASSGAGNV